LKFVIEAAGLTVAGGKELALDLMSRLAGHAEHQFTFLVPDLGPYKAISGSNIRVIVCRKDSGLLHRARLLNYEVPRICRDESADALLCLGNFVPWKRVCPTVVLLQNAWMVYRDPVAESRRTLRENLIMAYGRHAYRYLPRDITIITQTSVMKDRLCVRYGIDPGRVAIIPNTFSLAKPAGNGERTLSNGNEGARPFTFLCLAHCYAHKNIDILVDATGELPKYTDKSAKCVITVAPEQHPGAQRLLKRLGQAEVAGKIENIGPVPSEMLPKVYQIADALIFPTLLESFSRTYLEALYFGLPILTSDRDFAHNLCQNAAIYFDPLDAASVARAMARVMDDAGLRQRLVANGRRILAQAPTWDEIAARFVEVLECTARGKDGQSAIGSGQVGKHFGQWAVGSGQVGKDCGQSGEAQWQIASARPRTGPTSNHRLLPTADCPLPSGHCLLPTADCLPLSGHCPLPTAHCLPPSGHCLLPTADCLPLSRDVRTLFNQKARSWRSKYGPSGKLNSRVEQFALRLAELCLPPSHILDLGCGTGEIAAAIGQMGYDVTACDLAEEMIDVARRSHIGIAVNWVCLEPDWEVLPFEDGSFDGIVASSVFEYLDDVPRVAAELSRVLRPEGILLLTVPNPCNFVRKAEAWFGSVLFKHRLSWLRRVPQIDSYATYLRLSRNRYEGQEWQCVLSAAHFAALDERDFSREAWREQAKAPLVLLAVKREEFFINE
jgi:glycosyltransferase involved in cell wall biosynthesis/SAM-dependent methyltransferase